MTAPQLVAEAARIDANPYFLAYALATGAGTTQAAWERDGSGANFMAWNNARWSETLKRLGLAASTPHRNRFHGAHLETLAAAIPATEPTQLEMFVYG